MKKFHKISAVLSSVLLTGLTLGTAAAASFPAPFVDDGVADVAIVYGTGAGVSSLDMTQAEAIQTSLGGEVDGGSTITVDGGESFDLFDSDKLHFGDAMNTVIDSDLDENEMPAALAEGEYDSGKIDIDYEQSITLGSVASSLIVDTDLNDEEPTLGYFFDDAKVLDYTLTLKDGGANLSLMEETDFPLFGLDYYVLKAETGKLTLLNSAEKTVITEGETLTIDGKQVSVIYISDTAVKLSIDGEETDKLSEGEEYKLEDDSYVIISENLYSENGDSKAEFSIGSGKVVLENGQEVEVNDDAIDGMDVSITGTTLITEVKITWNTDGDVFLTEGDSIAMPTFERFSLAFGGIDFGSNTESISIDNGETMVLNMGNFDVDVMYNDTTTTERLGNNQGTLFLDTTSTSKVYYLGEDDQILGMVTDADLGDIDQFYYEVASLNNDTTEFDLSLNDLIGTNDMDFVDASVNDNDKEYDFTFTVNAVYDANDVIDTAYNATVNPEHANATHATEGFAVITVTHGTDTMHLSKVTSQEGLIVELPTTGNVGEVIKFYEANEDGDLATTFTTNTFNLTIGWDSDDDLYAYTSNSGLTMVDETADDKTVGYTESYHAVKIMEDSDVKSLDIMYHGDEVTSDLKLIAGGTVTSSASDALGDVLVKDTEVASMSSKNLVIVGGSCINSAAATVLGGAYCGAAFTDATGVGEGEFLIKGVQDAYTTGKLALVVAGYEAADTVNAATYLTNKAVDTSKEYKGTSASSAQLVVA